ncbi:hypothetical protein Tco_1392747 [Tanacetum coccineum]
MNQNHFEHNSNYSGFDQPPQYSIDHQEDLNQQRRSDVHIRWDKIEESLLNMMQSFCEVDKDYRNEDLLHGDEHLSTIPEKESDEFLKSSVEDLVPIPSESEDTSGRDNSNNDFTSSDDESLSDEDVPEDKNIESKDSYVSNLDEPALLVTPISEFNEDECFDSGGDVDEIEFLLHRDPSTPKINVAFILEGFTDEPPFEENDDLFDLESKENEWKKILYDAPIDGLMTKDKVFYPGIHDKKISPTYVSLPYEDCHYLSLTYVIRIFLPYLTYSMDSSLPLSSGSEDTIFDPGISAFHFSSLEPVVSHRSGTFMCFNVYLNILNESLMEIYFSTCFVPNITMIWGESN